MALKRRVEREIADKNIRARIRIYTAPDILFHLKLACAMYPGYQVLGLSQGGNALTLSEDDNRALTKFIQGQLNEIDAHWRRNEHVSIPGFLRRF
jgi:(p)ppGpp synthase/HD superfamily hydrolase